MCAADRFVPLCVLHRHYFCQTCGYILLFKLPFPRTTPLYMPTAQFVLACTAWLFAFLLVTYFVLCVSDSLLISLSLYFSFIFLLFLPLFVTRVQSLARSPSHVQHLSLSFNAPCRSLSAVAVDLCFNNICFTPPGPFASHVWTESPRSTGLI